MPHSYRTHDDHRAYLGELRAWGQSTDSGAFRCVGAPLARLMMEEFIREWLARVPEFTGGKTLTWGPVGAYYDPIAQRPDA
jgi:hypothetical protein